MQGRGIQSSIITNHPTQRIPTNLLHQEMVQHFPNHQLIKMKTKCFYEYKSKEFTKFCQKENIKKEFTHNNIIEKNNKTLIEVVKAMLSYFKLPKTFWGGALMTMNYLQNEAPIN
jgi:hypothetical protein